MKLSPEERANIKLQSSIVSLLAFKATHRVLLDGRKRLEDVELENSKVRAETVSQNGKITELEAHSTFLILDRKIPEEVLESATSMVLKRSEVCPDVLTGFLGHPGQAFLALLACGRGPICAGALDRQTGQSAS